MSTTIRPVISEKKTYWIERHRYYELKHFCLQYKSWKKILAALPYLEQQKLNADPVVEKNDISNPTADLAERRLYLANRIDMVETVAKETDEELAPFILKAVTEGLAYEPLNAQMTIPCSKDCWYGMYRRFFWLLDKARE